MKNALFALSILSVTACGVRLGSNSSNDAPSSTDGGMIGPDGGMLDPAIVGEEADGGIDRTGWALDPIQDVTVTTIAGGAASGSADGFGSAATFWNPVNLVIEPSGNLLVSDFDNGMLRRVTPEGNVTTVVAKGFFQRPFGVVVTKSGEVLVETDIDPVGDFSEYTGSIWKIDLSTGIPTAIVTDTGRPRGMVALSDGTVALSDLMAQTVRVLDPATGDLSNLAGMYQSAGLTDGDGPNARFNEAYGVAAMPNGDLIVADRLNHCLRLVNPSGTVSTFAGDGTRGMRDGARQQAKFNSPKAVAVDANGNIYVSDNGNYLIRRIDTNGVVKTIAGNGPGFADGTGAEARFFGQEGLDVTADGKTIFLADGTVGENPRPYHRIRKISIP